MRYVVITLLLAILVCLGSALLPVFRDDPQNARRTVKALTWRIALSVLLFVMLMSGHYFGWINTHL